MKLDPNWVAALAVVGIFFFTVVQAWLIRLSLRELLRPRMRIRSVGLSLDFDTLQETKGTPEIWLTLLNRGGSSARIPQGSNFTTRIEDSQEVEVWGWGEPKYIPPYDFAKGEVIKAGGEHAFRRVMDRALLPPELEGLRNGKKFLFVEGFIYYRWGRFKIPRFHRMYKMAFCWRYDVGLRRFVRVNNPDFDYED